MNRTSKYTEARREYVTSPTSVSIRQLAPKYERSYSAMARIARLEGWEVERVAFHNRTNEIVEAGAAEQLAGRLLKLNDTFLAATEESIAIYREKLASGDITPTPADVTKLVLTVRDMLAPRKADESPEASGAGLHISEAGLRQLAGALEPLARGRLAGGSMGAPAGPKLIGSSEG